MDYDFIVGFTLFNTTGFKTRFKHFDNLKEAIMFANNVDLKDNSKIYVDLKYLQDKIEELENYYRELYKQDNSPNEFLIGQDCLSKLSILQEVKQSLLEKE